jgi:hypothetical protein
VPADATAFAFRTAPLVLNINTRWSDPGETELHVSWTRELWKAMQPFSAGGVYVNFLGDEGPERVRAAFGATTYQRLARLKARYEPDNVFRLRPLPTVPVADA